MCLDKQASWCAASIVLRHECAHLCTCARDEFNDAVFALSTIIMNRFSSYAHAYMNSKSASAYNFSHIPLSRSLCVCVCVTVYPFYSFTSFDRFILV